MDSFLRFLEIVNTAELLTQSLLDSKEALDYISFDKGGGLKGIEYLKPLLKAIKEHRKINFKHFSYQTEKSRRYNMQPYLLKEYQNRWYIVGLVTGIKDFRSFGLDRISDLEVSNELYKPNFKINPKEKFTDAIGMIYSSDVKQRVVLSFSPSQGHYVKGLPWHKSQKIIKDDKAECRIQLHIIPNYELIQQILMHNNQVKVIEPEWLVEEIKSHLKRTLEQY